MTTGDEGHLTDEDQRSIWVDQMYDLLVANADGLTRRQLMGAFEPPIEDVGTFHDVKGRLQDKLGTDNITVVGDSSTSMNGAPGDREGWTYSLQGDPAHPDSRSYQVSKLKGLFGRQTRTYYVAKSLAKDVDRRTVFGRHAHELVKSNKRALEDLDAMLQDLGQPPMPMPA